MSVFGEQAYNAARIKVKGFGIHLNVADFATSDLDTAISELLRNNVYKHSIMEAYKINRS